jgi:hypothetical protein
VIARGMTASGKRIAALIGIALALLLPIRARCGYPGSWCEHATARCTPSELEPLGFYLIELIAKQDVGFAYSSDTDCR